ncbi:MAG TPA: papain-like cysteine protease family protein [Flexivirga sp.]|uniref:papain-like cysteine protease family protein n=1 Tax=Flexivirga sp. TaxID=1962927 RepID=UPI002CB53181|nr:papain-like cysteine protease family protein [Flexivirga sp.]HWC22111.1 papain-like cysteine protease family protein [Flexivirga sp.]
MQRTSRAGRLAAVVIAAATTALAVAGPAQATETHTATAQTVSNRATTNHAASQRVSAQWASTPSNYYLYIDGQAQEQSNWCWAATGNSVAAYFGYDYSQNQFCDMAFGYSTNVTCPNDQATLGNDQQAFSTIGINPGRYISGTISYSTLVDQISNNEPVMTRIGWTSGGGHMMVLTGYDQSNSQVQYYDPWPSDSRFNVSTYDWYRSNSQFTWTHTLYGIGA